MQPAYSIEIEKQMQEVFDRLSEKDKRLYAGVEALKFPYGGISYIAQLFSCSRNTILRGINELKEKATIPKKRDRKAGVVENKLFKNKRILMMCFFLF